MTMKFSFTYLLRLEKPFKKNKFNILICLKLSFHSIKWILNYFINVDSVMLHEMLNESNSCMLFTQTEQ